MTAAQPETVVRAEELTKSYGEGDGAVRALRGASFSIRRGEFVVLLGPSGSGKTTLLNQIGALEDPSGGRIQVMGRDLAALDEDGRTRHRLEVVGFVFQFYNLVPTLTVGENVALIAEISGPDAGRRTETAVDQVGLGERIDAFPAQLSGGEQQRVAIARALVKDPPLLLCDEPTGALDVETGKQVLELLRGVTERTRRTVVLVTHNSAIARMADRVMRLRDGAIVADQLNRQPLPAAELDW